MKKNKNQYSEIFHKINSRYTLLNIIVVLFLLLFFSCNFNYPEEKQETLYTSETDFHFDTGTQGGSVNFSITDMGNLSYRVIVYPQWMDVKKFEGALDNGFCSIPFMFKNVEDFVSDGRAEGYVFVRVGKSEIFRVTVSYGIRQIIEPPVEGQVPLYCSTAAIDFGLENSRSFTIANQGQVGKNWYIADIPSWLELSQTSGYLPGGMSLTINCTVNRAGLVPGEYSRIINIESNNPQLSHGVLVEMTVQDQGGPVNSSALKWFPGTVKDAYYCKATDYLYILTKLPNNLLVKAPASDSLVAYPLERIPNCMDVTADGKTIAIGYNQAYVDLLDAQTLGRIKLLETDCVPYDLVFGENGWCYLAPDEDQWVYFYSLNLTTGVTFRTSGTYFYEKSVLVKMPGKPWLYSTCPGSSPSGLQIINISKGAANDTIPRWHEDTGAMIWLSKDGSKIFGGDKEIYRTPDYTTETYHLDLPKTGTFDIPRTYLRSLDYNEKLHCYFAVGSDYWWGAENSANIYQVNETSFSAEKSLKVNPYPGYLNNQYNPAMDVYYVFSNSGGTRLFALKNVQRNLEMNIWALETFELPLN